MRLRGTMRLRGRGSTSTRVTLGLAVALAGLAGTAAGADARPSVPGGPTATAAACTKRKVPYQGSQKVIVVCDRNQPGSPGGGGGDGDGGGDHDPDNYVRCDPYSEVYPGSEPAPPPGTPPDARPYICRRFINGFPEYGPYIPRWLGPDEALLPAPATVAQNAIAQVEGMLHEPVPVTDPAVGTPLILDVPTFVAVGNWQPAFTHQSCDPTGLVCVVLTATPALTFDPGDDTDDIPCEPGGTRFDPAGADPRVQAEAAGACAHLYQQRTGVEGRPAAWPGELTVTWTVTWEAEDGSDAGAFPDIPMSADLPRQVEEVQTVVEDPAG